MKLLPKFLTPWHISVCLYVRVCVHLCVFVEENDYRFAMHIFRLPCCTLAHLTFPFDLFACFALDIGKAQPLSQPDSLSFCLSLYSTVCGSLYPSLCLQLWLHTLCLQSYTSFHLVSIYLHFRNLNPPLFRGDTTPDRHYTSVSWIFGLFFRGTRQHMFPRGRYLAPTQHVKDKTRHSAKSWLATIDYETWLRFQSRLRVSTSTSHSALCDLSTCYASCSTFVFTLSFPCRPSWLLSSRAHLTFHFFHLELSFIDCCVA